MKKILKALVTAAAVLFLIFITVFIMAKKKIIFLNEWFVNEKNNTIGVDISSYQSDVDMEELREQGIRFVFIKATEGSSSQDEMFPANCENAKNAGLPAGAYHFFSYDSPGSTQAENSIQIRISSIRKRILTI